LTDLLSNEQVSPANKLLSYGLDDWRTRAVFLAKAGDFSLLLSERFKAHPAFYKIGTVECLPRIRH